MIVRRERDWVLSEFKAGRSPILIATDVASRGLGMFSVLTLLRNDNVISVSRVGDTSSRQAGYLVILQSP